MRILTTRRISQVFFVILFVWFCVVSTLGDQWWQLRGWPVNWLIQLEAVVGRCDHRFDLVFGALFLWVDLPFWRSPSIGRLPDQAF